MKKTEIHKVQKYSDGYSLQVGGRISVLADLLRFVGSCLMLVVLVCWSLQVSAQTTYFRTESGIPFVPFLSSAPSSPVTGATYTNSTDGLTYWYNGTVWMPLSGSGLITSPSGRIWMDRNVGAYRAAISSTDYLAYGSLFQWCRGADGHQLIVWTSSTAGTPVNGTTTTLSSSVTPGHSLFIINPTGTLDWLSTQLSDASPWWNGSVAGINNPCPGGFHVPTATEWQAEITAGIGNVASAFNILKIPLAGYHSYNDGTLGGTGNPTNGGFCWSSTIGTGSRANGLNFNTTTITINNGFSRANAFSVRCIKD